MHNHAKRILPLLASVYPPSFGASGIRRFLLPVLLLALLPLAFSMSHDVPTFSDRVLRTIAAHPEDPGLKQRILYAQDQGYTYDQFFPLLPRHRLEGALLAYDSYMHWLIALGTALAFLLVLSWALPRVSRFRTLAIIMAFTATIGIALLLFFQVVADNVAASDRWIIGCGPSALFFIVLKFIGYSYSAADNPQNGFLLSFLGYTFGVGLCEEVTKALPLLFLARQNGEPDLSGKKLLLWGLVSGVGFGIAEGIMYSGSAYNGICGPDAYVLRFVSCVTLHAVWSGTVAMILCLRLLWLRDARHGWSYAFEVLLIVLAPMVLHGLYDTLLKQRHDLLALLVALLSTFFLACLVKMMHPEMAPATLATAPSNSATV